MSQSIAVNNHNSKIVQVDKELEEDSVTILEQSMELPNEQSKIKHISESQLQTSRKLEPQKDKKEDQPLVSAQFQKQVKESEISNSNIELTIEQVSEYFENKSKVMTSSEEPLKYSPEDIVVRVQKQIQEGILKVSKYPRQLSFNKSQNKVDEQKLKNDLQNKRYEVMQELKQIEEEETKLRSIKRSSNLRSKQKYELTEEDRKQIALLLKARKDFQDSLKQKNIKILEEAKKIKLEEQNRLKRQHEEANKIKKDKLLKHRDEIEAQKAERQIKLKRSVVRRVNAYTYKKNEKQWKRSQSLHQLEFKKRLEQIKERNALNIEEINQHEKKYSEQLESRILSQSKVQSSSPVQPKWKKTKFDRIIQEELFELKEKNKEKNLKILQKNFREKIERYQEKVDQQYKPKVDPTKSIVRPIEKAYSSISLSKEERVMKGLLYLEKAKEMKKNDTSGPSVNPQSTNSSKVSKIHSDESTAYKNYLKKKVPYNPLRKELNQILLEREEQRSYQDLLRAKFLSEGLQAKAKKQGDSSIFSSMKRKLKLLENIY